MILDIPFINKSIETYINKYNELQLDPIYDNIGTLSSILNRSYDLYTTPIYMNSRINYINYEEYNNFYNLLNGQFSYRPISNIYNKIKTHYIPKLSHGHKISDMILPIKTDKYQFISDINISNISIFYDSVLDIKLNIRPTLNIKIGKWINKKMVHEEHKLLYEMKEWSQFKLINKLDIDLHNINYIIIDGNDFLYIDNYIENIDKLDSIYLRLFI